MIASISGKVSQVQADALIIDINGLGFEVAVPHTLAVDTSVGELVFLHTSLIVREDLLAIYGFSTLEEKHFFSLLLGVGGIGPKLALAILSTLSLDMIRRSVISEEPDIFSRVPGVGKKTAQKILIHLQGRVIGTPGMDLGKASSRVDDQVVEALVGLGYSIVEAQTAVQALPRETPDTVEDKLTTALRYFDS